MCVSTAERMACAGAEYVDPGISTTHGWGARRNVKSRDKCSVRVSARGCGCICRRANNSMQKDAKCPSQGIRPKATMFCELLVHRCHTRVS